MPPDKPDNAPGLMQVLDSLNLGRAILSVQFPTHPTDLTPISFQPAACAVAVGFTLDFLNCGRAYADHLPMNASPTLLPWNP